MPRYTERSRRARALIQGYLRLQKRRRQRLQHASVIGRADASSHLSLSSSLTSSFSSSLDSSASDSSDSDDNAPKTTTRSFLLPYLEPLDALTASENFELFSRPVSQRLRPRWEGESEGSSAGDADDEDSEDEEAVPRVRHNLPPPPSRLGRHVRHALHQLYARRYQVPRNTLPRGPGFLPHVLHVYKHERPDLFRGALRVNPATFDRLVARLLDDPVFSNDSDNAQISVEEQVAITLYRFGHYGNAAGLQKVAQWAGCGKGTVDLVTRRVMTAVLRPDFLKEAIRLPTLAEKEKAKVWVEKHSCKGWRNGWCMVDGTLIPIDERPFWYGESYFDRKCNYSLNIQVCTSTCLYA